MTVLGFIKNCPACGENQYFAESKDWKCRSCDAVYGEETVEVNAPHIIIKDDSWIDTIPARMTGSLGMPGADSRKDTYKAVKAARNKVAADGHPDKDARLTMKIPPAVYHARMQQDRDYWKDPANVRRHKNWQVS